MLAEDLRDGSGFAGSKGRGQSEARRGTRSRAGAPGGRFCLAPPGSRCGAERARVRFDAEQQAGSTHRGAAICHCAKDRGESFFLGDVATQTLVTGFSQPVHGDNLVPIEIPELGESMEQKVELSINGRNGRIIKQAADGRVLIRFADGQEAWKDLAEEDFLWL